LGIVIIVATIIILLFLLLNHWANNKIDSSNTTTPTTTKQSSKLQATLSYLHDIPEIQWVIFNDNTVYIGFNPIPDDLSLVIKAAAM